MNLKPNNFSLRAVIFDMDGLMLDTERIYHRVWRAAGLEVGYPLPEEVIHATTGRTFADCYRLFVEAAGPGFPLEQFIDCWPRHWERAVMTEGIPLKPGLLELFAWLEAQQIPKAVATSTSNEEAHLTLQQAGIAHYFSLVVTGDQIANGKPAPDIYLLAAERIGIDAPHCAALEDSEAGVLAASAAGMYTIMVPDTKQPSADVAARARHVVPTLFEAQQLLAQAWPS